MVNRTINGKPIDWDKIYKKNSQSIAAGNAKMNARGDIIGDSGKVIKTVEEIEEEYNDTNPNAVKHVSIKQDAIKNKQKSDKQLKEQPEEQNFVSPSEALQQATNSTPKRKSSKRKIEDSDE